MPRRLPPIESLRVLEACVRTASFTRAAAEIGLTSSAVSLRMRNLETELGIALFVRSGPRLEPTRAARELAERVAEALQLVRTAIEACRSAPALRLTVVPSFASRWLTPRLSRYHAFPHATAVRVDCSAELRTAEDFDLAIRTGVGAWPNFDLTRLMPVESAPMLSPALAATVELKSAADIALLPLLPHDDWPRWFRFAGVSVNVSRLRFCADEYPTHELDAAAAQEGAGVALLSPTLFASALTERKLLQPFEPVLCGPNWHYLLQKIGDERPSVRSFRSWLSNEVKAVMQSYWPGV